MVSYTDPSDGTPKQDTQPVSAEGKQWVDTSQSPPELKIYDPATSTWLPADTNATVVSTSEPTPQVGKIWFEPAQGGTNMYAASSTNWEFLKFLSAIPDTVLDDFESGNLDPANNDWSNWSGDTGAANVQPSVVLEGSKTLEQGTKSLKTDYQNGSITPSRVSCLVRQQSRSGNSGDEFGIFLQNNGSQAVMVEFEQDGTFQNLSGSWETNSTYRVIIANIDWQTEIYDVSIRDVSASTEITSARSLSFRSSVSSMNEFRTRIDAGKFYLDFIEYSN
jgi:hypothetical protein